MCSSSLAAQFLETTSAKPAYLEEIEIRASLVFGKAILVL